MARQNHGPLSRAKGKLGGVVYQQYEGMQISREYQPNVKNPQSATQVQNRAKFKNASQLLAIFKEAITIRLAKSSIYTRMRRAVAVNALYSVAAVVDDEASTIPFEDAVAAINAKNMTEYAAPASVVSGQNYSVTAPTGATIFGVIAGFDDAGKLVARKVVSTTATSSPATFPILENVAAQRAMFLYTIAATEDGRAQYSNIISQSTELSIDVTRLVNEGTAEVSDISGVIHPAQP